MAAKPVSTFDTVDELCTAVISVLQDPKANAISVLPLVRKLYKNGTSKGVSYIQLCSSALQDGSDPIELLEHTASKASVPLPLAYLLIVLARLHDKDPESRRLLFDKLVNFTNHGNMQECLYIPELVGFAGDWLAFVANQASRPAVALSPILNLLHRYSALRPHSSALTPLHALLARICLETRNFPILLETLSHQIDDIDHTFAPVTARTFLEYHYYGGCILAAVGQHAEALAYFEQAVTIPGVAASAISLDAYKKYILVSLLSTGKTRSLPKYTTTIVLSTFKNLYGYYLDFQNAFTDFDRPKLRSLILSNQDAIQRDGNRGLVLQCLQRLRFEAVLRLRRTYITVTLEDVARTIEEDGSVTSETLHSAELDVQQLIAKKELFATIEKETDGRTVLTFVDDPEPFNTTTTIELLDRRLKTIKAAGQATGYLDDQVVLTKDFIQKAMSASVSGGMPGGMGMEEDIGFHPTEDQSLFA